MKRITQNTKLTIQVIIASLLVIAGMILLFSGFYTHPPGEIHDSVLIAYGEVSTFAGSLLGIDYHYKYRTHVINEEVRLKREQYAQEEQENIEEE